MAAQLPSVRGSARYVDIFIGCTGMSKVGEIELSHPICFEFLRETDRVDSDADFRLDVVGCRGFDVSSRHLRGRAPLLVQHSHPE